MLSVGVGKGKTFALSGFGNVAWGAAKKITELGGKVLTISGPDGYVYDKDGIRVHIYNATVVEE